VEETVNLTSDNAERMTEYSYTIHRCGRGPHNSTCWAAVWTPMTYTFIMGSSASEYQCNLFCSGKDKRAAYSRPKASSHLRASDSHATECRLCSPFG
jgi:hypothetical protein